MTTETSRKAYDRLVKSGKLGQRQLEVLEAVAKYGPGTASELRDRYHERTGNDLEGLWKRLPELRMKHAVTADDHRICGITGHDCMVWEISRKAS